jgi:hypothetical protein
MPLRQFLSQIGLRRQPSSHPIASLTRVRAQLPRASFPKRFSSTGPKPSAPSSASSHTASAVNQTSRIDKILSRLPPSLQKYTTNLRSAPVSHVVAFLLLHEITAVLPLLGLFGLFHYYSDHVPLGWMLDRYGGYVREGAARFERYFRRKGWFGFGAAGEDLNDGGRGARDNNTATGAQGQDAKEAVMERWQADAKYRVVLEIAVAWAATKALLPIRIVASLWATPWFARVLVRTQRLVGFGRKSAP